MKMGFFDKINDNMIVNAILIISLTEDTLKNLCRILCMYVCMSFINTYQTYMLYS